MAIGIDEVIPWILPMATGLAAYYGSINGIRVEVTRLEEKLRALERRFDSDHAELDKIKATTLPLPRTRP